MNIIQPGFIEIFAFKGNIKAKIILAVNKIEHIYALDDGTCAIHVSNDNFFKAHHSYEEIKEMINLVPVWKTT